MRRLLQKTFHPRTLKRLALAIRESARELIEAASRRGRLDVVADLAYPLPVMEIAELLGVPRKDRDQFRRWSTIIMGFQAVPLPTADAIAFESAASISCERATLP